jgi:hypothetical protein
MSIIVPVSGTSSGFPPEFPESLKKKKQKKKIV